MSKLRVGVIGVGAMATDDVHGHIPNYLKIPDVEVVAISDVNGARAQRVAHRFDISEVFIDYRRMLVQADLDAVSITAPNYLHATLAIGCLEHGVHVLVEKPMALRAQDARIMTETAKKHQKVLFVGMNNRFRDDTRSLKMMVQQGALGEVYYAKAGWLRRAKSLRTSSWFTSKAQAGSGPLWDIGLVMLDLSLWMLGFPKVKSVSGVVHRAGKEMPMLLTPLDKLYSKVENSVNALIRFEKGGALLLEMSTASMLGADDDIYLRLDGTSGGAELHNPESCDGNVLRVHGELFGTSMEFVPILPVSKQPSHYHQLKHFVDVCLGRQAPIITPSQGLEGIQIIEAIYRSAEAEQAIELPLLDKNRTA